MSRRRSTPWIHRWSRLLIAAIAALGALITGYLTVLKLTGGSAACPTSGCEQVLASPYATVFGLPLTLFGLLAYLSMVGFALAPLAINPAEKKELHTQVENWSWLLLFAGGTAMAIFSGYLMYLLAFEIKALCIYCLVSALCSFSLFVLTLLGRTWEDIGQLFFTGIVVGMVTLIGTLGIYASTKQAMNPDPANSGTAGSVTISPPNTQPQPDIGGWKMTTTSGEAELALADHLKQKGAKMYGAYWCPHCYEQKQLFGQEAFKQVTYVECAAGAKNAQPESCSNVGISSYPTWEINGKLEPGVQDLNKLADLTGYQGPRNFKYSYPERP